MDTLCHCSRSLSFERPDVLPLVHQDPRLATILHNNINMRIDLLLPFDCDQRYRFTGRDHCVTIVSWGQIRSAIHHDECSTTCAGHVSHDDICACGACHLQLSGFSNRHPQILEKISSFSENDNHGLVVGVNKNYLQSNACYYSFWGLGRLRPRETHTIRYSKPRATRLKLPGNLIELCSLSAGPVVLFQDSWCLGSGKLEASSF